MLLLSFGLLNAAYAADDSKLNKSNKLFDFAEENFPQFFSPSGRETFELDDYWVRYFSKTETYIGTLGEDVYVYGDVFNGLLILQGIYKKSEGNLSAEQLKELIQQTESLNSIQQAAAIYLLYKQMAAIS